jgi:hypothetical protein
VTKRPTSSAVPGGINTNLNKPGVIVHEPARKARPLTAAHARAMGRPQSGLNQNLTQKLNFTGSEPQNNFLVNTKDAKSLTSTHISMTTGAQNITEENYNYQKQSYIVKNYSTNLNPPIKEEKQKVSRKSLLGQRNY